MTDGEDTLLKTMRYMAWERAKGELNSIIQTYWVSGKRFDDLHEKIKSFIDDIENEGLQE